MNTYFKYFTDKELSEDLFLEMARIGFTEDGFEIYVHTDDAGNIPHFHYRDRTTVGQQFHTCIRLDKPEYFHHTGKEDVLNSKQKKNLIKFLNSKARSGWSTNFEKVIDEWNVNNSDVEISYDQPMPDYAKL